ncbi:MAG: peptidylprolyl isomerase [Anaerolineae bacterium]|jgi:FKBP-type peptidyl-prolyl cis-trans isomerase SlyD|nr:peptidylprolyl isomerase [Anaerolineae bacterium]MBT7073417.1 peptidylprolyl isomerase [Anaerolineae bacterium]MBT7783226.1 peptidylprolyl isomerase [Anaerolineae bacterium]
MTKEKKVEENLVVTIDYALSVDGEVIDSSDEREPLEFLQGHGNIISGLEREILGMKIGESKEVIVAPEDGYGEADEEAYMEIPTNQFPKNIPVEIGTELEVENEEGEPAYARIEEIENNIALLNFNHPLAGKILNFSVTIIALREPSEEELAHGHVHHEGHEH